MKRWQFRLFVVAMLALGAIQGLSVAVLLLLAAVAILLLAAKSPVVGAILITAICAVLAWWRNPKGGRRRWRR